jgi:hypothetical protein
MGVWVYGCTGVCVDDGVSDGERFGEGCRVRETERILDRALPHVGKS